MGLFFVMEMAMLLDFRQREIQPLNVDFAN